MRGREMQATAVLLVLLATTAVGGSVAAWLFPRAFPFLVLAERVPRDEILRRAETFFRVHDLAPAGASSRVAIRFQGDDSLMTYVDLAAGGRDTMNALVRGDDVAPLRWSVRVFRPRDAHETRVDLAPDGRLLGFQRRLAESDQRSDRGADSAQRAAEQVLRVWMSQATKSWRLVSTSYEIRKTSGRVDRTFTFERSDRRVGTAPIRMDVVVAGDLPTLARPYVVVPDSFRRRYGEMRSANELLALISGVGVLAFIVAAAFTLRHFSQQHRVRWRPALAIGAVIGAFAFAAALNELPGSWYDYDTVMSPATFQLVQLMQAVAIGLLETLLVGLTLAAAEAAARAAFPEHIDWFGAWKHLGTREVAGRIGGGYAAAALSMAYVVAFYLVTRRLFNWWVPTELLSDPDPLATPMPWLAGVAVSLHAGVWEEALFRALPLSLLSLWVGPRPRRRVWMAAGVVASALIFGFGHSDYPSWPPYSRGVEIFLDACVWGFLFLEFGILITIVAHYLYDLTLFGVFAASGHGIPYVVTGAIVSTAVLAPVIAVVVRWARQRALLPAPPDARFAAWQRVERVAAPVVMEHTSSTMIGRRARMVAIATIVAGAVAALVPARERALGPRFTASRDAVIAAADSLLRQRGVDVASWTRLAGTDGESFGPWRRFLLENRRPALAESLATSYAMPIWWKVRYVRPSGSLGGRSEEWAVRVRPDGVPADWEHIVADSAAAAPATLEELRRAARLELARTTIDTSVLRETRVDEVQRPARRDVTFTYTDSSVRLPASAAARIRIAFTGAVASQVRRSVELPERFVRADRDRQITRVLVSGVGITGIVGVVIACAIITMRTREPMVAGLPVARRMVIGACAIVGALLLAVAVNELPRSLAGYETTLPWSSFRITIAVTTVLVAVLGALALAAALLAVDGLRRRVGVPLLATPSGGRYGAAIAAAALGSLPVIAQLIRFPRSEEISQPPTTTLNDYVPGLTSILSIPVSALAALSVVAIPVLAVLGVSRRASVRLALALGALALAVVATATLRETSGGSLLAALSGVIVILLFALAIRAWGALGVAVWLMAAIASRAFETLHAGLYAATGIERAMNGVATLVAVGLFVVVARFSDRGAAAVRGDVA